MAERYSSITLSVSCDYGRISTKQMCLRDKRKPSGCAFFNSTMKKADLDPISSSAVSLSSSVIESLVLESSMSIASLTVVLGIIM